MDFAARKRKALESLVSELPDRSRKGGVDAGIVHIIDLLNECPSYFTTSSCAGRISILKESPRSHDSKRKACDWIFISHDPADSVHVESLVFAHSFAQHESAVFRFEPFILAVECLDISAAQLLVSLAISCGFRESGITSAGKRIMVALRCSIRLEVPIADEGQVLVSRCYIKYLVNIANKKMETNKNRTERFYQEFWEQLGNGTVLTDADKSGHSGKPRQIFHERRKKNSQNKQPTDYMNAELLSDVHHSKSLEMRQHDILSRLSALESILSCSSKMPSVITGAENNLIKSRMCEVTLGDGFVNASSFSSPNQSSEGPVDSFFHSSSARLDQRKIIVERIKVVGEPCGKLYRWGHTTCALDLVTSAPLVIFGGYGGLGRHSRKNDVLLMDVENGILRSLTVSNPPNPRVGHSAALVGQRMFIIGGREDPTRVNNDVWFLDITTLIWHVIKFNSFTFPERHRHASVVVGSCIYVFGGVRDNTIYGDLFVFDFNSLCWREVECKGELPCARHSHCLAATGKKIYLYGGLDGCRVLGDLYCFDAETGIWKKVIAKGKLPTPRFSHTMFIFNNYLGILGGCPHSREIAFLDLQHLVWSSVSILPNDCLLVRGTANIVGNDLIIIGGGSSCYAFGTKFNGPIKVNLRFLKKHDIASSYEKSDSEHSWNLLHATQKMRSKTHPTNPMVTGIAVKGVSYLSTDANNSSWIVKIEKNSAKIGKDLLKNLNWLDLSRKVKLSEQEGCVCFPITEEAVSSLQNKQDGLITSIDQNAIHYNSSIMRSNEDILNNKDFISLITLLHSCNAIISKEEISYRKREAKSTSALLREAVSSLLNQKCLSLSLLEELPKRWERLGDMAVLPIDSFRNESWSFLSQGLWKVVASALRAKRLARQGRISSNPTRDSTVELIYGENGWVEHKENGIVYCFDATKCMYSSGNVTEKIRMANLDCRDEVVVDLFAGIGYFVLPFLLKAGAKLVYACEWNPNALVALRHNVSVNGVENRCIILEGDNRISAPKGVANRVCLGLLPSSELSWCTAVEALRPDGGILHVHGNVKDTQEGSWIQYLVSSIEKFACDQGHLWTVKIEHLERVKWYAPHIRHVVADVRCALTC